MDIVICKIKYPNDPTGNIQAHQHFVGYISDDKIVLYSISSVLGKERRVYEKDGNLKEEIYLITKEAQKRCRLKVPSFIDCTKSYNVTLTPDMNIEKLSNREIPCWIRDDILDKIRELKQRGKHTEYFINTDDFLKYNKKKLLDKKN